MSAPLPENIEDAYPLSPLQRGMLFHSVNSPDSGVYIEQVTLTIDQPGFMADAFRKCWEVLIHRHTAFRTAFVWKDLDEPLQVVRKKVTLPWQEVDLRDNGESERGAALERLKTRDREAGFRLNKAPLMRMILARTGDGAYTWIWTRHHLVADGWSTSHVLRELRQLYRGEAMGEPAKLASAPKYRNYIAWLKQRDGTRDQRFWQDYLAGFRQSTVLGIEKNRSATHRLGRFDELSLRLSAGETGALEALCRSLRITPSSVVQGAWSMLLSRYSGSSDVVWGTTVSGRPAALEGVRESVGLFINTVPLRTSVDWDRPASAFLSEMQNNQRSVMAFENSDLSLIKQWSECPAGEPLFQSVVVYENYPVDPAEGDDTHDSANLCIAGIEYKEQSDLPLALIALPGKQLRLILIYDTSVFESRQVERMLAQLQCLLAGIPERPESPIRMLPFLPPEEEDLLLADFNDAEAAVDDSRFVDELILLKADERPETTALVCGDKRVTYGALADRSHLLASHLASKRIGAGDIVGIGLPRDVDALVWMLAVMRTGAAYLMLDTEYPAARLVEMLRQSDASLIVSDRAHASLFEAATCPLVIADDGGFQTPPADPVDLSPADRKGADTAYNLFTSGSTGVPKGVIISHRNLAHSTFARDCFYSEPPGTFLLLSSFSFDSSVAGIFWTLTNGGTLVISGLRQEQRVDNLVSTIADEGVTHTLCLPGLYHSILDFVASTRTREKLASLKLVINAGEAMPSGEYLDLHRSLLPGARIVNEYGPTEATVWCAAYDATGHDSDLPVPIGKPIANTQIHILDDAGALMPLGAIGELVVGGRNLSRGYLNDCQATREKFSTYPLIDGGNTVLYRTGDLARYTEDGNILYLGRADQQVKVRGHRIEPGEVESRLVACSGVKAAAVISHDPGGQSSRLLAFAEGESAQVNTDDIRHKLARHVPEYMVPDDIIFLDRLPLLANGKIDRQALAGLAEERDAGYRQNAAKPAPANGTQERLLQIWRDVLGIEGIGISDNFFRLGGDSILSIRIVSRMLQAGFDVGPNDIFEAPTIEALSARARKSQAAPPTAPAPSKEERDHVKQLYGEAATVAFPLTEIQMAFLFAYLSRGDADPGHMQIQARIAGDLDIALFKQCIGETVARHDALRSAIHWQGKSDPEQVVYSSQDVDIRYRDVHAEDAMETIDSALAEDRKHPLRIDRYPCWRITLFRTGQSDHVLCWTLHHALVDGWSASIALHEIIERYQAKLDGTTRVMPAAPQFVSYQHWLQRSGIEAVRDYWRNRLLPFDGRIENAPVLTTASEEGQQFSSYEISVSGDELVQLNRYLHRHQVTLTQVLQTVWGTCLSAASHDDQLAFFTTVSGRSAPLAGIDRMVGQFVNHLPVVIAKREGESFTDILRQIGEQSGSFREHDYIAPNVLLDWCEGPIDCRVDTDGGPLGIQSLVIMENFPWEQGKHIDHPNSIVFSSMQRRGRSERYSQAGVSSNFPVTLIGAPEENAFTVILYFTSASFDPVKAKNLMEQVKQLLEGLGNGMRAPDTDGLRRASQSFFNVERPEPGIRPNRNKGFVGTNATEKSIVAIWQEILGRRVEHVDQSFFDLGGNSISAVRVAEAVERLLKVKMPLALLIEHNTVRRLAKALQAKAKGKFQIVVPIQSHGPYTPVFGVHAEGNVLFYRDLSLCLGENQPFFGLQSPELDAGARQFDSISEMAGSYIREMKKVRPEGPYSLCGMCFGGLIAFEIAQQLIEDGDEVSALIVFDSGGPQLRKNAKPGAEDFRSKLQYSRTAPLIVKVFKHWRTGRLLHLSKSYISTMPLVYKLRNRAKKKDADQTTRDRIRQVRLNQAFLTRQYRANVYPGKVTFIYSEQFRNSEKTQYELDLWSQACEGRLESFLVSGHHRSILEAPQVYEVAEIVEKVLEQARTGPGD